jgi:antitoxin component YwqK of YwqJK toxin-antitoxin module|tara:strand:- start:374 stop:793 length:420 start_codon:yes stop_codon:yes gene_type:complete
MKTLSILLLLLLVSCSQEEGNIPVEKIIAVDQTSKNITDGEFIEHHPNGNIKTKGLLKNGNRTGIWTSYFVNGKVQSESKFDKGKLNGKTAAYYPNGNVQYMGLYINNEKDDLWFFYSEDGSFEKDVLFKNGEKVKTTP